MLDYLAQAVPTLSRRIAAPVADDAAVWRNYQSLRNHVPTVHKRSRCFTVGPAQAEVKIKIARELLHPIQRRPRVVSCQTDKLHASSSVLLAHFLVIRNFPPARSAPRRPKIHDDDFAAKVREAKASLVYRLKL